MSGLWVRVEICNQARLGTGNFALIAAALYIGSPCLRLLVSAEVSAIYRPLRRSCTRQLPEGSLLMVAIDPGLFHVHYVHREVQAEKIWAFLGAHTAHTFMLNL